MPIRVAIVGTGRLAAALARRLVDGIGREGEPEVDFLGFHGRDQARAQTSVNTVGAGRVLEATDLATAAVVICAVPDPVISEVAESLVGKGAVRPCSLWLHCAGGRTRQELSAVEAASARTAVLHPLAPVPDAAIGATNLRHAPALLVCEDRSERLALRIAERIGLEVERVPEHDAPTYHAACALAANGTTALVAEASRLMAEATGVPSEKALFWVLALASSALDGARAVGPAAALSGPIERGDPSTIEAHLDALETVDPDALPLYVEMMRAVLRLARSRRGPGPLDEVLARLLDERRR